MAKRITTEAKIVLERAGYVVEYVYGSGRQSGRVVALDVWAKPFEYICRLTVNDKCWIENELIENLLEKKN